MEGLYRYRNGGPLRKLLLALTFAPCVLTFAPCACDFPSFNWCKHSTCTGGGCHQLQLCVFSFSHWHKYFTCTHGGHHLQLSLVVRCTCSLLTSPFTVNKHMGAHCNLHCVVVVVVVCVCVHVRVCVRVRVCVCHPIAMPPIPCREVFRLLETCNPFQKNLMIKHVHAHILCKKLACKCRMYNNIITI